MYSDRYEPSWRKFTFRNFCEPLLQSFVIFGCKHLSACCRRGNSLCSMNVGILCENCIKIIFATTENTTSRWMLPRLYEIRCIRNFFYNMSKQPENKQAKHKYISGYFSSPRGCHLGHRMWRTFTQCSHSRSLSHWCPTFATMMYLLNWFFL